MIGRLRSRCSTAVLALAGAAGLGVVALAVLWLWIALSPRPPLLDGVAFSPVAVDRHGDLLRIGLATDGGYRPASYGLFCGMRTAFFTVIPA